LSGPSLIRGASVGLVDFVVLLTAAASWGLGSVLQTKMKPAASPLVSSAYQQLFGAGGMCVVVLLSNEQAAAPTADALLAWAYLIVFGSILAFTCYVTALRLLPTRIAMTYAYVNPILAVVLGAVLLHETVTLWVVAGAALIVLGVAGVFRSHQS
jgi:drug/metabolite transporter (DMT)-like permease